MSDIGSPSKTSFHFKHRSVSLTMVTHIRQITSKVNEGIRSIQNSPSELWLAYILKFLDSFSYFSFSIIFTLFLSADFGYSDLSAGTIYGAWGALVTLFGLFTGTLIDNLGVSLSLRIGFAIQLIAKMMIFFTTSKTILMISLTLLSLGGCLGIPVLTVGIRRYTNDENRGFAFGLFYVIMNFAALISGPIVDFCTILFHKEKDNEVGTSWSFSGYRLVVLLGIFTNILACIVVLKVKEIKVGSNDDESSPGGQQQVEKFHPSKAAPMKIMRETITSPDFWRFLTVCLITMNIRMIFRHLDATLPKYMVREFGEDVPKGTIYSINPLMIMILVPLITAATTKVDPLVMIHHGCYISAASIFFLAFWTSIPSCILFVMVLSIGESIWSPRLYDYTCKIAKEGREGTYMALASAPLFLAKLPVGLMSGYLLQKYCPEEGTRNSQMMWLIVGLITATSPVLLTLLWGYISKNHETEEPIYDQLPLQEYQMEAVKKTQQDAV